MDINTLELGVLMNFVVIQLGGDGVLWVLREIMTNCLFFQIS